jgi:mevalonate kinase
MMMVTTSVPARICLAGESLDWLAGGGSVVATIPLRTRVTAWRAGPPGQLVLTSGVPLNQTQLVEPGSHGEYSDVAPNHFMSAAAQTALSPGSGQGIVLTASTEIPVGAGVASSAAITLAVAAASLGLANGLEPDLQLVCAKARKAEVDDLRSGAGWMDFLACGYGGLNSLTCGVEPSVRPLREALGVAILLIDTLERRSTRKVIEESGERWRRGDSHIKEYINRMTRLVEGMDSALAIEPIDHEKVGSLLSEAQWHLRNLMRCSTTLIDECITRLLKVGVFGAKLTGSGHGGCLFALLPHDRVFPAIATVNDLPVCAFAFRDLEPDGLQCSFVQ